MENAQNDSVRDRLIQFITHLQISTRAFEVSCGLSNGFVKNISKGIGADKMRSILQIYPQLNSDWLITGEGNMLRSTIEQKIGDVKDSELHEVNVVKGDPDAYNTLLRIVETHQKETAGFQRNIEKFQEQIDRLLNLLEAKK